MSEVNTEIDLTPFDVADDTEVFYCPNGEWATLIEEGDRFIECGVLCGPTTYGELPHFMQQELKETQRARAKRR